MRDEICWRHSIAPHAVSYHFCPVQNFVECLRLRRSDILITTVIILWPFGSILTSSIRFSRWINMAPKAIEVHKDDKNPKTYDINMVGVKDWDQSKWSHQAI